ncbi:uncharacterized protein LOC126671383 [Mercurialis annua]|uniref:uncharacterized protein LOC126671383 n=1 Tax=Mercurialis annua TaxID=3986 RepID=UPI00215DDD6B|nr:uncharacterized protein LOC126671383 [Mercurialis annua]
MEELNVMAAELAIQRELAYRTKIAALQSPSSSKVCRELMPLEVQSSSLCPIPIPSPMSISGSSQLSGIKRQAVEICLPASETHEPAHGVDYTFCKDCQISISGYSNYIQHIDGRKHKLKLEELKFSRGSHDTISDLSNQRFSCDLCKIWCTNRNLLEAHLEGQKHKSALVKADLAKNIGVQIVIQQPRCELCNITCSDEQLLMMHFQGKKHKAKLQNLESGRKQGTETVNQHYRCELCNIWCIDRDSLNMHLQGKRHIVQLHGKGSRA